jgi:hypothetical protein
MVAEAVTNRTDADGQEHQPDTKPRREDPPPAGIPMRQPLALLPCLASGRTRSLAAAFPAIPTGPWSC